MSKHQQSTSGAQPKRTIPVPRIVKPGPGVASAIHAVPAKPTPGQPLKPANVMKAVHAQKQHAPWLTTAKIPRNAIPRIP